MCGLSGFALRNALERLLDGPWQIDTDEIGAGIQVIFAGFVNHTEEVVLLCEIVLHDLIELSQFERRRIVVIARTSSSSMTRRLIWRGRSSTAVFVCSAVTRPRTTRSDAHLCCAPPIF